MKNSIKKILKETYEKQYFSKLCNTLSTGDNRNSIIFMEKTIQDLRNLNLPPEKMQEIETIYNKWKRDIGDINKDRPTKGGLRGATSDSEGDISNFYLSAIQDRVCPLFMDMD